MVADLAADGVASAPPTLAGRRARLGLHSVLRELSGKRLAADRRAFIALAGDLLPPMWGAWCAETQALVASLTATLAAAEGGAVLPLPTPTARAHLPPADAFWLLGLKIVRRLLVSGLAAGGGSLEEPGQPVMDALPVLVQALQAVVAALDGGGAPPPAPRPPPPPSPARSAACAAALNLLKAARKLCEAHPWACLASGSLPAAMAVCGQLMGGGAGLAGVGGAAAADQPRSTSPPDQPPSPSWPAASAAAARTAAEMSTQAMVMVKVALDALVEAAPGALAGERNGNAPAAPGRTPPRLAGVRAAVRPQADALASCLLGPDGGGLRSLVNILIETHLPLTAGDADEWGACPEEWAVGAAAAAAAWRDTPRGAAEVLLCAAVRAAPGTLGPLLVARLQAACAGCPAGQARALAAAAGPHNHRRPASALPPAVLAREAAAAAVCVAAYDLHYAFPAPAVSAWVRQELLPDLVAFNTAGNDAPRSASPSLDPAAPLARRAALALAAFVPALSRGDRAAAYGPLAAALSGPDAAVALAAASFALRALVDDWGFEDGDFAPVAPSVITGLGRLLGGAPPACALSGLDAQAQAAGVLHLVIDRLANGTAHDGGAGATAALAACVPPLLSALLSIWAGPDGAGGRPRGSGAAPILRLQALSILARLVNALGPDYFTRADPAAGGMGGAGGTLLPMLASALDPASPDFETLAGDGCALLVSALRNAPSGTICDGMVALLPAVAAAAAASTENAPAALCAAASAALLSPATVTHPPVGPALASLFTSLAPIMNARGSIIMYAAADAVAAACPGGAGWHLLRGLGTHAAAGLLARPCDFDATVAGAAASLLARLALHSPSAAAELAVEAVATSPDAAAGVAAVLPPGAHPVAALAAALADRYDALPAAGSRLLVAHALCALLGSGAPGMAAALPSLAAAVTAAAAEEEDGGRGGGGCDQQFLFDALASAISAGSSGGGVDWAALDDSADAVPESERRAALRGASPMAGRTVGAALAAAAKAASVGPHGAAFAAAAAGLDARVAAAMNAAMRG